MLTRKDDFEELSIPERQKSTQWKMRILLIGICIIIGAALFWFSAGEDVKKEIKTKVEVIKGQVEGIREKVVGKVKDNPIDTITEIFTTTANPSVQNQIFIKIEPESVNILRSMNTPDSVNTQDPISIQEGVDPVIMSSVAELAVKPGVIVNIIAPVEEDSVVSMDFLNDMAKLMVSRYNPDNNSINLGIKSINVHYGTSLSGLNYEGQDFFNGREYILRYVFSPSMLSGLYKLYANKFINTIVEVATHPQEGKPLNKEQLNAMFKLYAKHIASISKVLANISNVEDLQSQIVNLQHVKKQAMDTQVRMNEAIFALDEAKDDSDSAVIEQLEADVSDLNSQYIKTIDERKQVQNNFTDYLRSYGSLDGVDDELLLYTAYWINRRLETQPDAMQSVSVAATLLNDLSSLFQSNASR